MKKNTTLEYSTRVVQEGDRRCEKSTLNDLAYLTPLRIPLMNPVYVMSDVDRRKSDWMERRVTNRGKTDGLKWKIAKPFC